MGRKGPTFASEDHDRDSRISQHENVVEYLIQEKGLMYFSCSGFELSDAYAVASKDPTWMTLRGYSRCI